MNKTIWKLAALAGVVGVGFLAVLQVQRGLSRPDGMGTDRARFEDFQSPDQTESDNESPLGDLVDNEIGFGQFEPGGGQPVDRSKNRDISREFPAADNTGNSALPNPFAIESNLAADSSANNGPDVSAAGTLVPRSTVTESEAPAGLDFRSDVVEPFAAPPPDPKARVADAAATIKDDPFAASTGDSAETVDGDPAASVAASTKVPQQKNPFARSDSTDGSTPTHQDTGPVIRRSSQNIEEPTAGDATTVPSEEQAENPFAVDGLSLFAPSTTRTADAETNPSAPETDAGKTQPVDDFSSSAAPFDEPPPSNSGQKAAELKRLIQLDHDPMPETTGSAPPTDRLAPDPAAFDENSSASEPGNRESKAAGDDREMPNVKEPTAAEATKSEVPIPRVLNGDATTSPDTVDPEKSVHATSGPSNPPNRLTPVPQAVRLVPLSEQDLAGDATVNENSPHGPRRPRLNVVKNAPRNIVLGQPLIYSIGVENVGDSPAHQVTIEDGIPKGTRLTGTIPQAEMFNKKLIWKIGTLKPKEKKTVQVRVIPLATGQVGSVATVNFVAEVASRTLVTSPSLKLELTGPQRTEVGQSVTLRFELTNNGTADATGIVIRDLIPAELSHAGGNDLEYRVGILPAGQTKTIDLTLTALKPGVVVNKAVVTADGKLTSEATARLQIVGPTLEITRSGPKRRYLGRRATFVNRVTNRGDRPLGPVTVVETIPAGVEFVKATEGGQFNPAKRTVAWRIDRIGPGESEEVSVVVVSTQTGVRSSLVTVTDAEGSRAQVKSQTEIVGLAALSTTLTGIKGPIAVGETVSLSVRVANRGNESASNVKLRIALPDGLKFVTSAGPFKATVSGSEVSFPPLRSLGPQQQTTLTVVLKAVAPGEARLNVQIVADHMTRPLSREEAIVIFADVP